MSDSRDPFTTARRLSLSRRGVLKLAAAASMLGVSGVRALAGDIAAMHERAIPSTGEKTPVVGLGHVRRVSNRARCQPGRPTRRIAPLRGVHLPLMG